MRTRAWWIGVLLLLASTAQAEPTVVLWDWEYNHGQADWQLLVVRIAEQDSTSTTTVLDPMSHSACKDTVQKDTHAAYMEGATWCAVWQCPGAGAYLLTLQARGREQESPYGNPLAVGKDAACRSIPYEQALLQQFAPANAVVSPSRPPAIPRHPPQVLTPPVMTPPPLPTLPPVMLPKPLSIQDEPEPGHEKTPTQNTKREQHDVWLYLCTQLYGPMSTSKCH